MLREAGILTEGNLYDIFNVSVVHHVQQVAARAHAVPPRRRLHRARRQGRHHRRVHRPHDGGPALLGRAAPGAGGQGGRHRPGRRTRRSPRSPSRTTSGSIPKLAGMTGTAMTEADEFAEIYKLDVVEIPTNVPVRAQGRGRRGLSHRRREIRGGGEADRRGARAAASRCWSAPPASRSARSISALLKQQAGAARTC